MKYDGLDPATLARRTRTPGLVVLAEVDSALDVLHELAAEGARAGTAVLADIQTRGRGRQGRSWHSPAGQGIWLTYLVRPPAPLETGVLALRVGLAVAAALEQLGAEPRVKWPNDVLLDGRKVAGILCEARAMPGEPGWVAVGVGINVHGPLPAGLAQSAVALDAILPVTRVAVLERLLPLLGGLALSPRLDEAEQRVYAALDWLRGRRLRAPAAGVACGIDADGALLVETRVGPRRVVAGSVELEHAQRRMRSEREMGNGKQETGNDPGESADR
jgi:BirA family biotin operon repressor/biotin-[acetyl-CoA-carboxylase] ligase